MSSKTPGSLLWMDIVYQRTLVISVLVCERSRREMEHLWRRCSFPTRSMFFPDRIQSGYRLAAEIYSGKEYNAVQSSSRLVAKTTSDTSRRTPRTRPAHLIAPQNRVPPGNTIQREVGSLAEGTQLYKRPSRPLFAARSVSWPLGREMFWVAHSIPSASVL